MEYLARRLTEQELLRPDATYDEAVRVLWTLCSFEAFDLLATGRDLTTDAVADLLITTAERTLLR
jgi:hypothetical protein